MFLDILCMMCYTSNAAFLARAVQIITKRDIYVYIASRRYISGFHQFGSARLAARFGMADHSRGFRRAAFVHGLRFHDNLGRHDNLGADVGAADEKIRHARGNARKRAAHRRRAFRLLDR